MDLDNQFPLNPAILHLNHAGVAPWPRVTTEAIVRFSEENLHFGSRHYRRWLDIEAELRRRLAQLINAETSDEIALLKNTSEALSTIAYGLEWQAGDSVVIARDEFPSNRIVWESLEGRFGVQVRKADLNTATAPEDALIELTDNSTRLISVSSVQYATGLRMDLQRLGAHCADNGILFCLDAIQSIGALPFDVRAIQADFVVADGHKWMLAPEGVALFYCPARHLERLRLNQYGWHMVERQGDFDRPDWGPAPSARRFECGSPNSLGIHALHASVGLLLEVGMEETARRISERLTYLIDRLEEMGLEVISPRETERRAGIVTFRHPDLDNELIYHVLQNRGVLCAFRAGGVRFSPHFYTPRRTLDDALAALADTIDAVHRQTRPRSAQ